MTGNWKLRCGISAVSAGLFWHERGREAGTSVIIADMSGQVGIPVGIPVDRGRTVIGYAEAKSSLLPIQRRNDLWKKHLCQFPVTRNVQVNFVRLLELIRQFKRKLGDDLDTARTEPGGDSVHILLALIVGDIAYSIVKKTSPHIQDDDLCSIRD